VADNAENCKLVIVNGENHASYVLNNEKLYNLLKKHGL